MRQESVLGVLLVHALCLLPDLQVCLVIIPACHAYWRPRPSDPALISTLERDRACGVSSKGMQNLTGAVIILQSVAQRRAELQGQGGDLPLEREAVRLSLPDGLQLSLCESAGDVPVPGGSQLSLSSFRTSIRVCVDLIV